MAAETRVLDTALTERLKNDSQEISQLKHG